MRIPPFSPASSLDVLCQFQDIFGSILFIEFVATERIQQAMIMEQVDMIQEGLPAEQSSRWACDSTCQYAVLQVIEALLGYPSVPGITACKFR